MYRARLDSGVARDSQRWVQDGVDISSEAIGVDFGNLSPTAQQRFGGNRPGRKGVQFGYRSSCLGDRYPFALRSTVNDLASPVAQIANAHIGHDYDCITRDTQSLIAAKEADRCCR
jgi:hypothetical protein